MRSVIIWICGVVFSAAYKEESHDFLAKAEDDLERQIKRIASLTIGDSKPAKEAQKVFDLCANRNIVIVLGNTKSCKSTVINLLMRNKLIGVLNQFKEYTVVRNDGNHPDTGPVIGLKPGQAETSVPSVWCPSDKLRLSMTDLLIDVPGFDDSRGPVQDIANSFYIRQILNKAKTVKIILISDINDISQDVPKGFVDLIAKVHTIFSGSLEVMNSASIVFSKCEPKQIEHIEKRLRLILDNPDIKIGKELVEHFLKTSDSIGIFHRPMAEGPIDISTAEKIAHIISHTKAVSLSEKKIHLGISSDSKVLLYKVLSQFTDPNKLIPLTNSIKVFCDKQTRECKEAILSKDIERIIKIKSKLLRLQGQFPKPMCSHAALELLAAVPSKAFSSVEDEHSVPKPFSSMSLTSRGSGWFSAEETELSEELSLKMFKCLERVDKDIREAIGQVAVFSSIKLLSFVKDLCMIDESWKWFLPVNNLLMYMDSQLKQNIANVYDAILQIVVTEMLAQKQIINDQIKQLDDNDHASKKTGKLTRVMYRVNDYMIPGLGVLWEWLADMQTKELQLLFPNVKAYFKLMEQFLDVDFEMVQAIIKAEQKKTQDLDALRYPPENYEKSVLAIVENWKASIKEKDQQARKRILDIATEMILLGQEMITEGKLMGSAKIIECGETFKEAGEKLSNIQTPPITLDKDWGVL